MPRIMVGGGGDGKDGKAGMGSNILETLLAVLLAERTGYTVTDLGSRDPDLEALRSKVRASVMGSLKATPAPPTAPPDRR